MCTTLVKRESIGLNQAIPADQSPSSVLQSRSIDDFGDDQKGTIFRYSSRTMRTCNNLTDTQLRFEMRKRGSAYSSENLENSRWREFLFAATTNLSRKFSCYSGFGTSEPRANDDINDTAE